MNSSTQELSELEAQLAPLHSAGFEWAMSCCGWDEFDAEDVLQSTYVKVISGRAQFSGRSSFKTWLFGVIRQTAREYLRTERSQRERAVRLASETPVEDSVEEPQTLGVEHAQTAAALRSALAELPQQQRQVLHLVFYEDFTVREAAEVMEVSLGTARVHYDRGKKRMRTLLADRDPRGGAE